jgi:hypothetical protein
MDQKAIQVNINIRLLTPILLSPVAGRSRPRLTDASLDVPLT